MIVLRVWTQTEIAAQNIKAAVVGKAEEAQDKAEELAGKAQVHCCSPFLCFCE